MSVVFVVIHKDMDAFVYLGQSVDFTLGKSVDLTLPKFVDAKLPITGLILFRFAMILTVLRQMDNGTFPLPEDPDSPSIPFNPESLLICADSDFNTALAMVKVLLQHSVTVYLSLPRHDFYRPRGHRGTNDKRQAFYNALPDSFDRFTYLRTAAALNVTEKTAERYIAEFCKAGQLTHPANDKYQKPSS